MKLGIVGTGKIVQEFLPYLKDIEGITLNGICGTLRSKETVERLCQEYQIPWGVTEYSKLLELDIDAVYVVVPNALHYEFCLQALKAGKHVIVEKPMTSNYKEAEELSLLARENHLFLFEAITTIYLDNYKKIKELLPLIGDVKLVECNFSQYSSRYDAFQLGEVHPVFDPNQSGGTLMDLNLYNLHYVLGLFGVPEKVEYHANIERNIDTSGVVFMNYPSFQAVCIAAKDCSSPARYVIQGTKGYIMQTTTANICGEISLHLNDGTVKNYNENLMSHRMISEFQAFQRLMSLGDLRECYDKLDHSLSVSKVLYDARVSAGIRFRADEK